MMQWRVGPYRLELVLESSTVEPLAVVWKDQKREGWRGFWRLMNWFFMPSAEVTMDAIEREMAQSPFLREYLPASRVLVTNTFIETLESVSH